MSMSGRSSEENNLFETLVQELVSELDDDQTRALVGSHARGQPSPYSDVDLSHFTRTPSPPEQRRLFLEQRQVVEKACAQSRSRFLG